MGNIPSITLFRMDSFDANNTTSIHNRRSITDGDRPGRLCQYVRRFGRPEEVSDGSDAVGIPRAGGSRNPTRTRSRSRGDVDARHAGPIRSNSARGFGGRFFFYDEKSRPVPVDGTLIVHGFDDTADTPEDRVKRFEFTPEQFTRHFSQTDLGASYSVWVPWDAIGGDQRRISLVA